MYEGQKKKRLVEIIVNVVLLVLRFVGEAGIFAEGMVNLGRMLRLASDLGLAGSTAYSVVEDPTMALVGGARTPKSFETTTAAQRKMTSNGIEKMEPVFKENDIKFQGVVGQRACVQLDAKIPYRE
ncbi:hypothetical protein BBP40_005493 [Aspergillus hancockii]|nr:hypothetical protein BBP40_005493 [Aspergillus hancockii]